MALARRPTAVPDEISETKMRVTLLVEGMVSKGKQKIKDGTIDVQFTKRGMAVTVSYTKNGNENRFEYKVRKFPSDILETSTWKVENGKVIVDLMKKESMLWQPMILRGLDQADSSSEEED